MQDLILLSNCREIYFLCQIKPGRGHVPPCARSEVSPRQEKHLVPRSLGLCAELIQGRIQPASGARIPIHLAQGSQSLTRFPQAGAGRSKLWACLLAARSSNEPNSPASGQARVGQVHAMQKPAGGPQPPGTLPLASLRGADPWGERNQLLWSTQQSIIATGFSLGHSLIQHYKPNAFIAQHCIFGWRIGE